MGMECMFQSLTPSQIATLEADPSLTFAAFFPNTDGEGAKQFKESLCEGLDLGKDWAILNYLILEAKGASDAYDWLVSGDEIGEPFDFGGPSLRTVEETQKLATLLQSLTPEELMSHFDLRKMLEEEIYHVYKDDLDDEKRERELREDVSSLYLRFRDYVSKAAASGCGLLSAIA